jgi:hypothetical protein
VVVDDLGVVVVEEEEEEEEEDRVVRMMEKVCWVRSLIRSDRCLVVW